MNMNESPPVSIWWKDADERGAACLSLEVVGGPKRYYRIWSPGRDDEVREWGWVVADTAECLYTEPEQAP